MYRALSVGLLALALSACQPAPPAGPTAPVYKVVASGLTAGEAEQLQAAFDLEQLALDDSGAVGFADEAAFLSVPTRKLDPSAAQTETRGEDPGEVVYEGLDFEAIKKIRTLDRERAAERVATALEKAGLAPENASPRITNTRFEAVGIGGEPLIDQAIDTTVSYEFRLGELPLEGPGAKLRVALDGDGRVVSLRHSLRRLEPAGSVAILDDEKAVDRCATWTTTGSGAGKITQATLAYYAPPLSARLERLEPSFRCHSEHPNGAIGQVYFVPAALDAVRPQLEVSEPDRPDDGGPTAAAIAPAASPFARDDVGSEGTGPCSGLPDTATNIASFNNRMTANGVAVQFSWVNANAWEQDWKDPANGGDDADWVDDVDMAYWQGHGWPGGFSFSGCSSNDDTSLTNTDALWGNRNAEWISLFTCLILKKDSGGQSWAQRWGGAFDRLHQINSFDTVSYHSASHGGVFVNHMMGIPYAWWLQPMKVRQAWAQASIDDQPAQVIWATMGVLSNGNLSNFNDYFWGRGAVGPDIPAAQKQGYWRISGGS